MNLIKELKRADFITILSLILIITAFRYLLVGQQSLAIGIMLLSVLTDFLDGHVARRFGGSDYGKYLDSSYDTLSFLLFPSMYLLVSSDFTVWALLCGIAVIVTGCLRLARFTYQGFDDPDLKHYIGMPVFYIGLVPLAIYIGLPTWLIITYMITASFFMVSEIKFLKPKHPVFVLLLLILATGFLV